MLKAREDGLVRHIGFTGHHNPDAHLHLLKATDVMEATQMPINIVDPGFRSFIRLVLPEVVARGMGVQAMKSLAGGKFIRPRADAPGEGGLLIPGRVSLREAVHFVWSLPVSVLVMGSDNVAQMREQIELARAFAPLDAAAREALVERVADMAGRKVEGYKRPM
jgi:predicted aldo/keto reductase-like oxidoreductase